MRFNVGDKVRNVGDTPAAWNGDDGPVVGQVYTVDDVSTNGGYIGLAEFRSKYPCHNRSAHKYELAGQADTVTFDLLGAMTGKKLRFRSGCEVRFVAYVPDAKPHCQLVLINPATGNIVTRYANGKSSEEPYSEPGDILVEAA
jgi:hypothetical protein